MKFRATLLLAGKTATGFEVPPEVVEALGTGKRPAVTVTVNNFSYRSTVAPMGGVFMLPVSAENRVGAGIAAGDDVEVNLELDSAPREVVVPPDFATALEADAEAKKFFDGLSFSHKRQYTLWVEGTKNADTRARRIEKAITMLREGRTQS